MKYLLVIIGSVGSLFFLFNWCIARNDSLNLVLALTLGMAIARIWKIERRLTELEALNNDRHQNIVSQKSAPAKGATVCEQQTTNEK
jgi:hypothetical protein